jgi:hypothetical protein
MNEPELMPVYSNLSIVELEAMLRQKEQQVAAGQNNHKRGPLWDGLLHRGDITLLLGGWKSGKSTLIAELIRHLGRGEEFLGRSTFAASVCVLTDEPLSVWVKRHRDRPFPPTLRVSPQYELTPPVRMKELQSFLDAAVATRPDLVVVDSLAGLLPPGAEGNACVLSQVIDRLKNIPRIPAVLVVHHPGKSRSSDMVSRGSGFLPAAANCIIEFGAYSTHPDDRCRRLLRIRSRRAQLPYAIACEWRPDDGTYIPVELPPADPGDRRPAIIRAILDDRPQRAATILDLLTEWPDDAEPVGRAALIKVLGRCVERSELRRTGRGVKSSPYVYRPNDSTPIDASPSARNERSPDESATV